MRRLLQTLAVVVLLAGACADGSDAQPIPCYSIDDCGPGEVCLGTCVAAPDFSFEVTVAPVEGSGYLTQTFRHVDLSDVRDPGLSLIVPPPAQVEGEVRLGSSSEAPPAEARLTFTATEGLVRPLSFSAETFDDPEPLGQFALQVVAGTKDFKSDLVDPLLYGITVTPKGATCELDGPCPVPFLPPPVRLDTGEPLRLAFPDVVTRVAGRVIVTNDKGERRPKAGIQVQLTDALGGGHGLPAVTDEDGGFLVAVAASARPTDLQIVLKPGDGLGPTPVVTHLLEGVEPGAVLDGVELELGDHRPADVQGRLVDADARPIAFARVAFSGEAAGGGRFETTVFTDFEGRFSAQVVRGTYSVRAVPPADSPAATIECETEVFDGPEHVLQLVSESLRPRVVGTIGAELEASGEDDEPGPQGPTPVPEVTVVAELARDSEQPGAVRRFETVTDETGAYALPVDPGDYRLHFIPLPAGGLARTVGPPITVLPGIDFPLPGAVLEPASSIPGLALGSVQDGTTRPLRAARIEVHARIGTEAFLLWEGLTAEREPEGEASPKAGSFTVRLPRSLTVRWENRTLWAPPEP